MQLTFIILGSILLFLAQSYGIGYIKWYKGQNIPHCRQKQNLGQSKDDIDNRIIANPSTIR